MATSLHRRWVECWCHYTTTVLTTDSWSHLHSGKDANVRNGSKADTTLMSGMGEKSDIPLKTISTGRIWDGCENQRFMVIT